MNNPKKNVCIVGGGMGSLSAAIYLNKKGFDVSIYEKNSTLGGRANIIEENGFKFDVGPSLLNYPWIFENLFEEAGEEMRDHIDLIEIDSGVKFLWDDKETFTITSDFPKLSNEIARLEKSHINGLNSFLKINSRRYNTAFEKLLNKNLDNPVRWGTGLGAKELFSGSMFKSMYKDLGAHFKSRHIKEAFGSYAMYLGGSPFKIPGFFSILPYGEIAYGLWMPKGGIYSLIEKFADNEIVFIPNSPYLHIEKLKPYIQKAETIGVLYKQNDYGLKVFNHFKKNYPLIYTKSSSFGTSAIDLELSVNLLGSLDELDFIIIIDDTYSYKDLVGYLATDKKTYPLEKVYLIDNFLEQRNNLENYYKPINRSNFDNIDITEMIEPHREYLFKQSIEVALSIADKTLQKQNFLNKIDHENLGNLNIKNQMIDYPIIFD